tara:strand:- start:1184 stop:1447 length:264 start_codon:yes stop_codon:yes gene_type:complete
MSSNNPDLTQKEVGTKSEANTARIIFTRSNTSPSLTSSSSSSANKQTERDRSTGKKRKSKTRGLVKQQSSQVADIELTMAGTGIEAT